MLSKLRTSTTTSLSRTLTRTFSVSTPSRSPATWSSVLAARLFSSTSSIPPTMPALVVNTPSPSPSSLEFDPAWPSPSPSSLKDGEVIVENHYAGVNFIDTYHRSGLYPRPLPFVCGQEAGGVVVHTTPISEAQGLTVGTRVAYSVLGTYCKYTTVPAAKILPVPDHLSLPKAISCVVQGLTAHYLTSSAHANLISPGQWMLIHGVGGGTGQWACQMAKAQGYRVIGTVSKGKAEAVKALDACEELIVLDEVKGAKFEDYTSVDVVGRVMEVTKGVGAHAVVDGIGLSTVDISIDCLAQRGIFISFGNASGAVPAFPVLRLIGKSGFVTRPKLLDYTRNREELLSRAEEVFGWIEEGKLKVTVDKIFGLEEAGKAHEFLQSGASEGKVLYKI